MKPILPLFTCPFIARVSATRASSISRLSSHKSHRVNSTRGWDAVEMRPRSRRNTIQQPRVRTRAPIAPTNSLQKESKARGTMDEDKDCASAERKEIAARVATFKATQERFQRERAEATQERFQRERAEYFAATL